MDTLLQHGTYATTRGGLPTTAAGIQLLLQQAMIRLTIPCGAFAYDTALGSRLHTLQNSPNEQTERAARVAVEEALYPLRQLQVEAVSCHVPHADTLIITIDLFVIGQPYRLEVNLP